MFIENNFIQYFQIATVKFIHSVKNTIKKGRRMKTLQFIALSILLCFAGINILEAKKCPAGQRRNDQGKCVKKSRVDQAKRRKAKKKAIRTAREKALADQANAINLAAWNTLSNDGQDVDDITTAQIAGLTAGIIKAITGDQMNDFTAVQMAAFTGPQVQGFTIDQIQPLTIEQLQVIFKFLTNAQIAWLVASNDPTTDSLNTLITAWTMPLTPEQIVFISKLKALQIPGLNNAVIAKIFTHLSQDQRTALTTEQKAALPAPAVTASAAGSVQIPA